MADVTEYLAERADGINEHLRVYLETDGAEGHIYAPEGSGARADATALLLKTVGRKSGRDSIVPLFYDKVGDDFIVIASKAGSDNHPVWYLNLVERPDVRFQVARDKYQGTWRILEGAERETAWNQIAEMFPTYWDYMKLTSRVIPVIALTAVEKIPAL